MSKKINKSKDIILHCLWGVVSLYFGFMIMSIITIISHYSAMWFYFPFLAIFSYIIYFRFEDNFINFFQK